MWNKNVMKRMKSVFVFMRTNIDLSVNIPQEYTLKDVRI